MRISKIKYNKDELTVITCDDNPSLQKETKHKSYNKPHDDFIEALNSLEEALRGICYFSDEWCENKIKIIGVSISFSSNEIKGACITGLCDIRDGGSPLTINTPHLPYENYSETGTSPTMPVKYQELINNLEKEAIEFLKGKKSQKSLNL